MRNNVFIVFFLVCLLGPIKGYCQGELYNVLINGTVQLKYDGGGSASGVIVSDSNYFYLVTARHCLIKEFSETSTQLIDSALKFYSYKNDPFTDKPDSFQLSLSTAYRNGNIFFDSIQDISICVIAKVLKYTSDGNSVFSYSSCLKKLGKNSPGGIGPDLIKGFDDVKVGLDCVIFGFPAALKLYNKNDYDFERPLLRKGAIAGKDKKVGSIIVDCPSYQGNSGGPVFTVSELNANAVGLIGIVSRSILNVETLESSYYRSTVSINFTNSGYTVVVPIQFAVELMTKYTLTSKGFK